MTGRSRITRAVLVVVISVALIAWFLLRHDARRRSSRARASWATEAVYGLVRNGVARDVIGSQDFLRFVPLLFTLFMFILVNNLFGIIPPSSSRR